MSLNRALQWNAFMASFIIETGRPAPWKISSLLTTWRKYTITKWEEVFKFLENTIPSLPVVPALPIYEEPSYPTLPGSYELPVLPIFIGEPNGNYIKFLGEGNWNNNLGEFGNYQVFSNVSSYHVSSIYVWEKANTSLEIKFNFTSNNFFEVYTSIGTVGVGFCVDGE